MECRFCFLDRNRQRVIQRYQDVFVIASNPRLLPGHMLVISQRHITLASKLTPEEYCNAWMVAREIQNKILLAPGAGCYVGQHSLPFMVKDGDTEYTVGHFHIHVIPREYGDPWYTEVQIHEKPLFDKGFLSPEQMRQEEERLTKLYFLS